jgi:hypothetical protein
MVAVASGDRWGFMDRSGLMAIDTKYLDAHPFFEGLAAVKTPAGGWVYIDMAGNVALKPQWHNRPALDVGKFSEGLAAVAFDISDGQ